MQNSSLRFGMFILFSGFILMGYHRAFNTDSLLDYSVKTIDNNRASNPLYELLFQEQVTAQLIRDYVPFDVFLELITPFLVLLLGWRLLLVLPLVHLVVTSSCFYNLFSKPTTEFQLSMKLITIIQMLGIFLYMFSIKSKKKIPHPQT